MRVTPGPVPRDDSKGESRKRDRSSDRTWSFSSISTPCPGFSTSILPPSSCRRPNFSLSSNRHGGVKKELFWCDRNGLALKPRFPASRIHKGPKTNATKTSHFHKKFIFAH